MNEGMHQNISPAPMRFAGKIFTVQGGATVGKRLSALYLAICVAVLAGCAKTTIVSIAPENGETYRNAKTIYVVLKTGETCEMRLFTVTPDAIVGTRVLRSDGGKVVEQPAYKIGLNEISTVQVIEWKGRNWFILGGLGFGCLFGATLGLMAVLVWLVTRPW